MWGLTYCSGWGVAGIATAPEKSRSGIATDAGGGGVDVVGGLGSESGDIGPRCFDGSRLSLIASGG